TCNVHHADGRLDADALGRLIERERPDLVAFQDWSPVYIPRVFRSPGWNVRSAGQFCIASRMPLGPIELLPDPAGLDVPAALAKVALRGRTLSFYAVHLTSPRSALEPALTFRAEAFPNMAT